MKIFHSFLFLYFFFVAVIYGNPPAQESGNIITFHLDVRDKTDFSGGFNLPEAFSKICREVFEATGRYQVIPMDVSGVPARLKVEINKYSHYGKGITSYGLGGYEEVSAKVSTAAEYSSAGTKPVAFISETEITEKDIGLSLWKGPVGDDRVMNSMREAWRLAPEDEQFNASLHGAVLRKHASRLLLEVSRVVLGVPLGLSGTVRSVRGSRIYTNIKKDSGLKEDDMMEVYSPDTEKTVLGPEMVGRIKITRFDVFGRAEGEDIENTGMIKPGDMLYFGK